MKKFVLKYLLLFIVLSFSDRALAALTFDWNGSSTSWTSSGSWTETGGTGSYPGAAGRTTDIVRFGVTGSSYTNQPLLTTSLTVASITFGGGIQKNGTQITVNGSVLTVGTIVQDINTTSNNNTIFDYLQGTGTITAGSITVGSGTATTGNFNFLLSDVNTLNVTGNVTVISNVNKPQGSGFRLEDGDMYLSGIITFSSVGTITASNASYFTINTVTQASGTATNPHLYLSNPNPVGTIPSPHASVNFYGDHGGVSSVSYTAASPNITTTATAGFGTGGGTIDTTKASYDNLLISGSGLATVGGSTVGALKVAGDLTTSSPVTFSPAGASATNTSVGGNWTNSSTVTGGAGTTAVTGTLSNSGTMTLSTGNVYIGTDLTNTSAANFTAGAGDVVVDGSVSNAKNFTLSSGDLTIKGNYTNSAGGVFTPGSGSVNFDGASPEALTDNSTTGTTFNNVDFNGGGTKTMSGTGSFSIAGIGVLTMEAGNILQTGNILTLISTSTSTATVAAIPSNSSITGTVNAQRYISGGSNAYRGYRLLSSPVYTVKSGTNYYYDLSYLALYAPITGTTGTAGGLTKFGNPSMYLYRDNVAFTNSTFNTGNFRGVNKINNSPLYLIGVDFDGSFNLQPGTGVLFFYRGNLTNIATKYILTTVAEPNVFSSTGTLNQQSVTVTNWYTGLPALQYSTVPGNTGYSGFNLVGNPYASSIDWDTFSATSSTAGIYGPNVGTTTYICNTTVKAYATYNAGVGTLGASHIIPSGQGFFVKAVPGGATLTFNESAKTNAQLTGPTQPSGTTLLLNAMPVAAIKATPQFLRLQLYTDSVDYDETIVRFDNNAKNGFVFNEDSQYLPGTGILGLSSMSADNVPLAINVIPYPKGKGEVIKLNVNATVDGAFSLNLTEVKDVPKRFEVWLRDSYKKDSLNLRTVASYKFNVTLDDTNSFGPARFSLLIRPDSRQEGRITDYKAVKTHEGSKLTWKTEDNKNYKDFKIKRSTDNGKTFHALGTVFASDLGSYSFLDKNPADGLNTYRIEAADVNDSVTYSEPMPLMYSGTSNNMVNNTVSVYPNPAATTITLSIAQNGLASSGDVNTSYGIQIVNNSGSVIKSANLSQASWQYNVSNLLPGTYIIQVVNNYDKSIVGKSKFIKL